MKSIWEIPFIVVDVETSGSNSKNNKIMEIACVTTIGGEITNVFSSLINPHEAIPPFISNMTGITDAMTKNAPEAIDVIPRVEEIFNKKNAVFVAHNARFDWSFIVETFNLAGLPKPSLSRLCTLKLARRLLPKSVKKNLGELANYFDITVINRHRASGDAIATAHVLNELLELAEQEHGISNVTELIKFQNKQIRNFRASATIKKKFENILDELPETPGVFTFLDEHSTPLYIGRAKSLKDKVVRFFNHEIMLSKKLSEMIRDADDLLWEETNSALSAITLEHTMIPQLSPPYNTATKIVSNNPYIKLTKNNRFPYIEICFNIKNDEAEYYGPFKNVITAQQLITMIENKTKIRKCDDKLNPSPENKPCYFYYQNRCDAPCNKNITSEEYAKEVEKAHELLVTNFGSPIKQLERQLDLFNENFDKTKTNNLKEQLNLLKQNFENRFTPFLKSNNTDSVLLYPISEREKTLELFLIKKGKVIYNQVIGRRAELKEFINLISNEFYNGSINEEKLTKSDNKTLRLIQLYMHRHQGLGKLINKGNKSKTEFLDEVITSINNIKI